MTFLERTDRPTRVTLVTAGLSAVGGVVGGLCAGTAFSVIAVLQSGFDVLTSGGTLGVLAVATGFGVVAGMIGAPLLGWGMLRTVPLGRVILYTALGTIIGSVAGQMLSALDPDPYIFPGVIVGGFLGFVVAGIGLRVHTSLTRGSSDADRAG